MFRDSKTCQEKNMKLMIIIKFGADTLFICVWWLKSSLSCWPFWLREHRPLVINTLHTRYNIPLAQSNVQILKTKINTHNTIYLSLRLWQMHKYVWVVTRGLNNESPIAEKIFSTKDRVETEYQVNTHPYYSLWEPSQDPFWSVDPLPEKV